MHRDKSKARCFKNPSRVFQEALSSLLAQNKEKTGSVGLSTHQLYHYDRLFQTHTA